MTSFLCVAVALEKAGGYYYNTGGSEKIINGQVKIKRGEIIEYDDATAIFNDGTSESYDIVGK